MSQSKVLLFLFAMSTTALAAMSRHTATPENSSGIVVVPSVATPAKVEKLGFPAPGIDALVQAKNEEQLKEALLAAFNAPEVRAQIAQILQHERSILFTAGIKDAQAQTAALGQAHYALPEKIKLEISNAGVDTKESKLLVQTWNLLKEWVKPAYPFIGAAILFTLIAYIIAGRIPVIGVWIQEEIRNFYFGSGLLTAAWAWTKSFAVGTPDIDASRSKIVDATGAVLGGAWKAIAAGAKFASTGFAGYARWICF